MINEHTTQNQSETAASVELIAKMKAQLGHIFDVDYVGNLTLKPTFNIPPFTIIFVKGGEFTMGDETRIDNKPHPVKLSPFFMGEYPATQELYLAVTGKNPSHFQGINHPVEQVNWFDALDFCNILNSKIGFSRICNTDYEPVDSNGRKTDDITRVTGFRLPTEAEWEYAARGGTADVAETHDRASLQHRASLQQYAGSNFLDDVGWYEKNNDEETRPVGMKFSNALGIFDMSGNVWEWCWDWYSYDIHENKSQIINPINLNTGSGRVLRGGLWSSTSDPCRMVERARAGPIQRWNRYSFRLLFTFQFT